MHILKILPLVLFSMPLLGCLAQNQPNVVLILSDDQGWGDLSLHGNPWLETPNLDKLAKSGERFDQCYVSPLCAPTRASLLTGRYHLKTSVVSVSKGLEVMDSDETTLAELFKSNGYKTGIFGKWHNGQHYPNRPNDQGFDEFLGFSAGHWSNYFNTTLSHNDKTVKTKGYITDVLTDAALKFMHKHKNKSFFCYIPYNAPHSPHQVPDAYFNKYKAKGLDDELASIYGMVENIDDNVGRILTYLSKNKLEENTIVIFLTDNGPNGKRYNGNMRGTKGSVHEGGGRVPFFISWKNHIPANTIIQKPIAHIDLYPTLLALCQLKEIPTKPIDGINLSPLMLSGAETRAAERNLYTHVNFMDVPVTYNSGGFRNDRYRFVFENNMPQLYDLLNDPGEHSDLAAQNPTLTNAYVNEYKQWIQNATTGIAYNRPITLSAIGTTLPTYEANLSTGVKFKEGHGWAHDWIERWNTTYDSIFWAIQCVKPGKYLVEIDYLCNEEELGSAITCSIGNESRTINIQKASHAKQIQSPDRVKRKEAYEMHNWKRMKIGSFNISGAQHLVKLKALKIGHENVLELYQLRLKFLK
jgi:arylsulfatase A-like enzyme